ncbi:MAG: nucleotidyltransferase family protein [Candidatus Bathyarchaeia archaeon]
MPKSLEEVKQQLQTVKPMLKKRFKVETIDIFGSYARGSQTENSDLDLLVTWSVPEDLFLIYDLRQYLRRKLGVKVDIIAKEFLNKHIREQVLEEAVPV